MGTRIAVLIPAHNEQDYIAVTIEGVQAQTRPADRIIVVPNNCDDDDDTAKIAAKYDGVEVMELHGITGRKAGALNAALDAVLPELAEDDLVVCMDADTVIHPELLENAERHFQEEPGLGAVSSNHLIKRFGTLIELLQAMEYERDRRFIGRRKGRFGCMTGMAAMYRVAALREVKRVYGEVYDPDNWTEDWKLTIALKHLRWGMVRPQDCLATTVPVSDARGLFLQRERWARGYIQNAVPVRPHAVDRHPVGQAGWPGVVGGVPGRAPLPALDHARSPARMVVPAGLHHPDGRQRQHRA